mgnify:CR=1 FL=1
METTMSSIRPVSIGRSFVWLQRGAQDFAARPVASLSYGVLLALTGFLIVALAGRHPHLLTASISGFFLIGPFLGIGLYRLSQAREAGETITLWQSFTAWRANPWSIAMFGVLLAGRNRWRWRCGCGLVFSHGQANQSSLVSGR